MVDSDNDSDISNDSLQNEPGSLTEKQISGGLSNRGYSADGTQLVYLDLSLTNKNLSNISLLENYRFIQNLDISNNSLKDISVISQLKYLLNLNASNNLLKSLPSLAPPLNLLTADLSHNEITEMSYIGEVGSLLTLNLNNNTIRMISGLVGCSSLKELCLNNNQITQIGGLETLQLHHLHLNSNHLNKITGLDQLASLQTLNIANNNIRSLRGLQGKMVLSQLNLDGNDIIDLLEIKQLQGLPLLRRLSLINNPLTSLPDYRAHLLFYLAHLSHLDEIKILPEEKIAALNQFDPPLEVVAAQNHMMHVVKNLIHPIHLKASVSSDASVLYPILVLTGPNGSGKSELAARLVQHSSHSFKIIRLFSTKKLSGDSKTLISISQDEFNEMADNGDFIVTYDIGGASFGLRSVDIEDAANEGVASVICMELEGVLSLKRTTYQARIALISPMDSKIHGSRMRSRERYTEPIMALAVKRTDMYNKYHSDNTGVFDLAINSDDMDKAFEKLSQLIDYYSGQRSGVGPGQGEIINVASELGHRRWSCGSASTFDNQQNFPRKQAIIKGAVKGVTHPITPPSMKYVSSKSSTSFVYPDTGELSNLSNTEFSSSTELSATAHSLVQLRNISIPPAPLSNRTM